MAACKSGQNKSIFHFGEIGGPVFVFFFTSAAKAEQTAMHTWRGEFCMSQAHLWSTAKI